MNNKKINAREILGLPPQQAGPVYTHDAGVAATIMDGTVYRAAIDLWIANGATDPFDAYARLALESLDVFRAEVSAWSQEKNSVETTKEVTV